MNFSGNLHFICKLSQLMVDASRFRNLAEKSRQMAADDELDHFTKHSLFEAAEHYLEIADELEESSVNTGAA